MHITFGNQSTGTTVAYDNIKLPILRGVYRLVVDLLVKGPGEVQFARATMIPEDTRNLSEGQTDIPSWQGEDPKE